MIRTLLFGLLFISPPALKPWILRYGFGARVGRGVQIGWFAALRGRRIELGDYSAVRAFTVISCDGDIVLGRYALVSSFNLVYGAAGLFVGEHSYIGPQSLINADEDVRIGRWSALGARCMVYTHGSFLPYTEGYWVRFGSVTVGDYVWCAAGVFLHPGVVIGDDSFVNSRSVVSGELPPGSVAEGNPARVIGEMARLRRSMSPRRLDAAALTIARHFSDLTLRRAWGATVTERPNGTFAFTHNGAAYRIVCVPAHGDPPAPAAARTIWLSTRPNWRPTGSAHWLDLAGNRMTHDRDPIYHELALFLKRYYGIQLEYAEEAA
jgi:acetyltransferase-like isoleucine patch superfamily enzyme